MARIPTLRLPIGLQAGRPDDPPAPAGSGTQPVAAAAETAQHPTPDLLEAREPHPHDPLEDLAFWAMAKTFQG
jgi:hypothetical protein